MNLDNIFNNKMKNRLTHSLKTAATPRFFAQLPALATVFPRVNSNPKNRTAVAATMTFLNTRGGSF